MPASRARRASNGPASASASTLTITRCLPSSQHARTWAMPAAGLPVASMTISISGAAMRVSASSVTNVAQVAAAAANERALERSASQPARASDARARSGARSAMPTTWMPAVCFACARYIDPNLPAPMRPTRSGRAFAARASSIRCRFMRCSMQRERQPERHEQDRHHVADQHNRCDLARFLSVLLGHHEIEHCRRQAAEDEQEALLRRVEFENR